MKRKIPCLCENTFTVEVPEEINLDERPQYLDEIINGTFMNFSCLSCGKKHKPEFPVTVLWPSRDLVLEVLPEESRISFYREKKEKQKGGKIETVISYPELSDRIAVLRDGLDPMAVEALKYYLQLKAEETNPDKEIGVWYQQKTGKNGSEALEFHVHGLQQDSVAVTKVPLAVYEKTLADYRRHPRGELFTSLRFRSYVSIRNMMLSEGIK
jgi:hypothetical protein